jgi:UDP-N-acetylglucosamine acyltransferase
MISNLAQVSSGATIGNNVTIEAFSNIYEDVVIGDGTRIHSNVVIYPGTRIGENCEVFPGAVIGAVPQDLKYKGEYTTTEIGNNTVIRELVTIHRGTIDRMTTKIGDYCLIMNGVHVAHDCLVGNHVIIAGFSGLSGHCIVEDYAIIEGMVGTQQFMKIGAHSFIAGATLIRKSVPPFVKAAKEPITYAGVNSVGLRRRGFDDKTVREIEDIYRTLYVMNTNLSKGIDQVLNEIPDSPIRRQILSFIESCDKGIIRGMI